MKADAGPPSPRCTLHAYGTSAPLRVPKAPGENRPAGPAGSKGALACNGLRRERILPRSPLPGNLDMGPGRPALMGPATGRKSTPLGRRANRLDGTIRAGPALWGPHTGDRRSETGLCEIGSGELARVRRGHETRAQCRLIGDNCCTAAMMAPPVSCSEQVPLDPMSPMDCADSSVRIGPTGDISRFRAHRQSL
jgi:hypothetical protein